MPGSYQQLQGFRVCQICGRGTTTDSAEGWLVSPRISDPMTMVVRCPQHITNHALRISYVGRTKEWRERAANPPEAPSIHPFNEPFPLIIRRGNVPVVDSKEEEQ